MGEYKCVRCTGHGEYKDREEAILLLDHSLGLSKGRPCRGGDTAPIIEVVPAAAPTPKPQAKAKATEKPKESKASEK